jgi:DNA mismatch repair protein PMS2
LQVNGRPIEWPRLSRGVNEVWRTFEMKHKPAFVLDVTVDRDDVDVNVAPDKREVRTPSWDRMPLYPSF